MNDKPTTLMTDSQAECIGKNIFRGVNNAGMFLSLTGMTAIFAWIALHGGLACAIVGGLGFLYFVAAFIRNAVS